MSTALTNTCNYRAIAKIPVLQKKIFPLYQAGNRGIFWHGLCSI